jgi:hypothetical protein
MGFLKKIFDQLSTSQREDPNAAYVYVQCDKCGEKLRARVSVRSELSPEFGNSDKAIAYHCRKVLIGEQLCFQQIEVNLKFNNRYKIVDKQISGGKFITRAEYEQE